MAKRYTDEELWEFARYYDSHGAVKLPGLVEPQAVETILKEVDLAAAHADEEPPTYAVSYGRGPGRMTIRYMWRVNPVVKQFLLQKDLVDAVARIVDTTQLRLWFDLTFIHESGAPGGGAGSRGRYR